MRIYFNLSLHIELFVDSVIEGNGLSEVCIQAEVHQSKTKLRDLRQNNIGNHLMLLIRN